MCKLVAILAIVVSLGTVYQTHQMLQEGVKYLKNEFPDFSYKDGVLDVQSENAIIISAEDSALGYTIIDTKTEDEQKKNEYLESIKKANSGVIVLKDRIILKNPSVVETTEYEYKDMLSQAGITSFYKNDVINYVNSSQIFNVYAAVFLMVFIYAFLMYLLTTISNVFILSGFGFIATWLAKMKIRYVAIFNMSVYALTLSTILNMLYVAVNIFIRFNMEYFQVMYVAVAAIYLVAAIFLLKSDVIKRQIELTKLAEAQEIVRKELEKQEEEEKREQEKKERKEKDKKENNDKKDDVGEEPEGSNA